MRESGHPLRHSLFSFQDINLANGFSNWRGWRAKFRAAPPRTFQTAKEPENKSTRTIFWNGKRNFFKIKKIFMITESNFPNSDLPSEKPKGGFILAILLGLLTFVVTSVIALVIAIPFFFLEKISESFNPIVIIAGIFGLRELGGFFAAQFILIAFFALLGDFVTAIISWFINRSKKLATVTFFSALIFQIIAVAFVLPAALKKSQETMNAGIEREKYFEQYATIGDVSFETQEPFSESRGINGKLVEVSLFKKLVLVVPISVSRAGSYQVNAQYSDKEIGSTPMKDVTQTLNVGTNIVKIEFLADESREYGYTSPKSAGGTAKIQLSYLASQKELLDSLKSDSTTDQKILQQFMKDEGLDKGVNSNPTVSKFVGRKEVQF